MNPIQRATAGLKAFAMRFGSYSRSWWVGWGRTRIDYRAEVGDGRSNSIVEACIGWIQRTFPEAPVRIVSVNAQGEEVPQDDHALKLLLDTPNPFYPGELLWSATLADRTADGNAYWLKVRSGAGRVVQLWWVPHTMMEPKWPVDGTVFISHYEYTPGGFTPIRIDPADVVHFRWGLDPRNPRKGCSPLKSLLREIFTDDEAGNYTASMLRNTGVPPVVISPGKDAKPTQDELEEVKNTYVQRTTGDQRGMPIVMRGETSIQVIGFNPQQMDMRMARRVPEERVSAVLGIPAAVVGLGTGLENTKVGATMAQMREQAYESNIIPTQRLMGAELRTQLVPDFGDVRKLRLEFDLSQVRVLQADQNDLHTRAREDLKAGGVTVNEFREMIDLEPLDGPAGDVLYVPIGVTPTHPDEIAAAAPAAPPPSLPGQPAKVHALPARREHKDGSTVGPALRRLRTGLQPSAERELARFLAAQAERVAGRLGGKRKADLPTPEDLLGPDEEKRLRAILEAIHQRMLQGVHALVEDALGIAFDLDDATTRAFLTAAGSQIVGISETTRQAVRDALQAGQAEGEGLSELAARIRDLPAFNQARGQLVARTELGHASNLAAVHSYRASGVVVGVRVLDGDFDEACAAMDGRTFTLDEAPAPLQHPNCTRALVPLTDASQLEEAA